MAISTIASTDNGAVSLVKINDNFTDLDTTKADLASPALTGNPTAPTQSASDNSTKLATTEYVETAVISATVPTAKTLIPWTNRNMLNGAANGNITQVDHEDAATVMRVGQVVVPFEIEINKITFQAAKDTGDGTFKFAIFSEDGQTRHINESMTIGTNNEATIHSLASPVTLSPGVYYVAVVPTATGVQMQYLAWLTYTNIDPVVWLNAPTGLPVMEGTLTVTSATIPTTITPTAITPALNSTFVVRLDT
jgi:hypothetical protein